MVHRSFAGHIAGFVRIDMTMVMIVMDNVGVAVAIESCPRGISFC